MNLRRKIVWARKAIFVGLVKIVSIISTRAKRFAFALAFPAVLIAACLCTCMDAAAQTPPSPLRSLKNLRTALKSTEPCPVELEATLTYWDPERNKVFIQDAGEAIFVKHSFAKTPGLDPPAMSRVKIRGWIHPGKGFIESTSLEVLDRKTEIAPVEVDIAALPKGSFWSRYVTVQGKLLSVVVDQNYTRITLQSGERKVICSLFGADLEQKYGPLIGGKLRVPGVMDWDTHESGAPRTALMQVASESEIVVLSKGKKPFTDTEFVQIASLVALKDLKPGAKVRAFGSVTFIRPGIGFLLEDETDGVVVDCEASASFSLGDKLGVDGTIVRSNRENHIYLERVSQTDEVIHTRPVMRVTARQVLLEQIRNRQIAIGGMINEIHHANSVCEVLLQEEEFTFSVVFPATKSDVRVLGLDKGERVICQGFVHHGSDTESVWFSVQANGPAAVISDRDNRLQIEQSMLVWGVLGIAGAVAASLIWISAMRYQVKRKTQHLADLTASLNASYDAIQEGIMVADLSGSVIAANQRFNAITGIQDTKDCTTNVLRLHLQTRYSKHDADSFWDALGGKLVSHPIETELLTADGSQKLIAYLAPVQSESGEQIGKLLAIQDVTTQRDLESKLLQSQKMEAVGRLAGGIAHDFNNLLMVMGFNVRHTRDLVATGNPEVDQNLQDTELAVDRASKLVQNLLGFSRQSQIQPKVSSLNDCVENVLSLLRRAVPSTIQLDVQLDSNLWLSRLDALQIEQVIMNICLNARDAVTDDVGLIEISTSNVQDRHGKKVVALRVTDNGAGMSDAERLRLFEPFFTTKSAGEGTGLGMAMSYGIVAQHQGEIDCQSQTDVGTRISVYLPALSQAQLPATPNTTPRSIASKTRLQGHVLVVDDDDAVRRATASMMSSLGCEVIEANGGKEALTLVAEHQFDLVMLDLNMPEMSGREVFRMLGQTNPSLPIVICTGYIKDQDDFSVGDGMRRTAFLQKPYSHTQVQNVCGPLLVQVQTH